MVNVNWITAGITLLVIYHLVKGWTLNGVFSSTQLPLLTSLQQSLFYLSVQFRNIHIYLPTSLNQHLQPHRQTRVRVEEAKGLRVCQLFSGHT